MIKMFKTYWRVRDMFIRPSIRFYCGYWQKDPNWWGGTRWRIYLCPRKKLHKYTYQVKDSVLYQIGTKEMPLRDKTYTVKQYDRSTHKLPHNLTSWDIVWNRDIRKKLREYHLSWLPPIIYLPNWFCVSAVCRDVGWKTKWGDVRYEFPPVFCIRLFGLSISAALYCPIKNDFACNDHYWETLLNYLYYNKSRTLLETIEHMGIWSRFGKNDEQTHFFAVRPEYIKPKHLEEYYAAISTIRTRYDYAIL